MISKILPYPSQHAPSFPILTLDWTNPNPNTILHPRCLVYRYAPNLLALNSSPCLARPLAHWLRQTDSAPSSPTAGVSQQHMCAHPRWSLKWCAIGTTMAHLTVHIRLSPSNKGMSSIKNQSSRYGGLRIADNVIWSKKCFVTKNCHLS